MSRWRRAEAADAVEAAVERFVSSTLDERLRLYRLQLQASIHATSPLAVDLAASAGVPLAEVAALLPVPRDWPPSSLSFRPQPRKGRMQPPARRADPTLSSSTGMRLGRTGAAIRGIDDPAGDLGFFPERGVLEVVSRIGRTTLQTNGGHGSAIIGDVLPESILMAAVGRPIETIVSHPALDGRGYIVSSAFNDSFIEGAALVFGTGLVPLELPWADGLDRAVVDRFVDLASMAVHGSTVMASRYADLT